MSTTVETRVEYDDRFRQRPELVKGAEEAMAYLDTLIGTNPNVPPPSVIRWAVRPLDPQSVELAMADETDNSRAVRVFPVRYLTAADPYARETFAGRVWSDLLDLRWQTLRKQINQQIAAFFANPDAGVAEPLEPQTVP